MKQQDANHVVIFENCMRLISYEEVLEWLKKG